MKTACSPASQKHIVQGGVRHLSGSIMHMLLSCTCLDCLVIPSKQLGHVCHVVLGQPPKLLFAPPAHMKVVSSYTITECRYLMQAWPLSYLLRPRG